jgi:hypothetical protein
VYAAFAGGDLTSINCGALSMRKQQWHARLGGSYPSRSNIRLITSCYEPGWPD